MKVNADSTRVIVERSGWSTARFAAAVGVTPSHMTNVLAGRRQCSPEVIKEMARVLEVPLMALISEYTPEEINGIIRPVVAAS